MLGALNPATLAIKTHMHSIAKHVPKQAHSPRWDEQATKRTDKQEINQVSNVSSKSIHTGRIS